MTKELLFHMGLHSFQARRVIGRHMGHTLPRPAMVNGQPVAEFWYFSAESTDEQSRDYIKLYAAIHVRTGEIIRLRTFSPVNPEEEFFETGYLFRRMSNGKRYLRQCAKLLGQDRINYDEMVKLQQRWYDLQPSWVKNHFSVRDISLSRHHGLMERTGGNNHVFGNFKYDV